MRRLSVLAFGLAIAVPAIALVVEWARAWMLSPDLAWGWAVPLMCGYFLWVRRIDLPARSPAISSAGAAGVAIGVAMALAAACRLWLEPFPGWPLMEWSYSLSMLAVIWGLIERFHGRARANHLLFPLALGLVAIPWPAFVTERIIGSIRIGLAGMVAEMLSALHWPAAATGTTIETARGSVGIDEACGGIHSLQTAVLVGLAVGELRRARWPGRVGWLGTGIVLALFFNALRIGFLAWECAQGGTTAAAAWHDTAATAEMLLILGALGGLAILPGATVVRRTVQAPARPSENSLAPFDMAQNSLAPLATPSEPGSSSLAPLRRLAACVGAGVVLTEVGVAVWFGGGGRAGERGLVWAAHLPDQLLSYEAEPYTEVMDGLLRADRHELGRWRDASGLRREAYVLEWNRGQRAQYVLRGHNPDICLGLAGSEPLARGRTTAAAGRTPLPFETRVFRRLGSDFYVYFLAWDLTDNVPFPWGSSDESPDAPNAWSSRWKEIAGRRRTFSARVLTIAIFDAPDQTAANAGFHEALGLITRQ